MAQPKTLAVVHQDFQRRRRPVAEHEDPAAERVVPQHVFADLGQAVDSFAKIGRLDGHHDPHLRRDLDHGAGFQKLRLSAARSGVATPFRWTRIFAPPASSNSNVHSQSPRRRGRGQFQAKREAMAVAAAFSRIEGGGGLLFDPFLERVVVQPQRPGRPVKPVRARPPSPPRPTASRGCASGLYASDANARIAAERPPGGPEGGVSCWYSSAVLHKVVC